MERGAAVQADVEPLVDTAEGLLGVPAAQWEGRGFAALGGSSLDAVRLARALRREHRTRITAPALLRADDLAETLRTLAGSPRTDEPAAGTGTAPPAGRTDAPVPLSWQQRVVWYQSVLDPDSPRYHFHAVFRFTRAPAPHQLEAVLGSLLDRHPALRTRVDGVDGVPVQRVGARETPRVRVVDTDRQSLPGPECLLLADANRPFDLAEGLPLRWTLIRRPDGGGILVHTEHHLVHDGESFNLILAGLDGSAPAGTDDGYLDYAARQIPPSAKDVAAAADHFTHDFPELFAAPDAAVPAPGEDTGLRLPLPQRVTEAVRTRARERGLTLFTVLFGAYAQALGEATGNRSLVLGTAVANRPENLADTVGMFVATALVPLDLGARADREGAYDHVDAQLRRAVESVTDLTELVEELRRRGVRGASHPGAAFSMYEQSARTVRLGGRTADVEAGIFSGAAKFPVNAIAVVHPGAEGRVELLLEGQAHIVDEDGLWRLWTLFVRELCDFAGLPEPAADLGEPTRSVPELIRETAMAHGGLPALTDRDESFDYADLARLGDEARAAGLAGEVVGLLSGVRARYWAYAAALMDAGAAYLPLDTAQPVERLVSMLRQTGCVRVVDLTGPEHPTLAAELSRAAPDTAVTDWQGLLTAPRTAPAAPVTWPEPPAYVLFTSGSTGQPKGVAVGHRSLTAVCEWSVGQFRLTRGTVVSQQMSVGFDYSGLEVWPALTVGGDVRVVPTDVRLDAEDFVAWLNHQRVEVACAPTPVAELLLEADWPAGTVLRTLLPGGDRLHPLPRRVPFDVVNLYGPTECTIVATGIRVDQDSAELPPIGRALDCGRHRVVDASGRPVGPGTAGELWLGGGNLALGYWGRPEATAQRFVPDPWSPGGDLVYRTGDIVEEDPDGVLHYIGRADRQIKVSGARVELGEVEAAAMRRPGVKSAVAATVRRTDAGTALELYAVPERGADHAALAAGIRDALPSYIRHTRVVLVDRLPLNANGKVDLAMLTATGGSDDAVEAPDARPLLDAARAFLLDEDLDKSWFELGGSSLDAAQLVSRLRSRGLAEIELRDLLLTSSVEEYLTSRAGTATPPPAEGATTPTPAPAPPPAPAPAHAPAPAAVPPPAAPAPVRAVRAPAATTAASVLWPALEALEPHEQLDLAQRLIAEARARL
ncbi:AMP-binding protein [Streptomyces castrisilvae]|uniref:AMP-binding protein n=1 Tax=Streptomyces castrisilvae TaxID=3033811 RepID=A0ABY9HBZ3_9ACTN|nr:AMP-binding protein [Streptomyces sp. Mut1]WLQ31990.1 AMP-binding protein [Streptomyces sp. Mut1]